MAHHDLTVRPFTLDEVADAFQLLRLAFGGTAQEGDLDAERSVFEPDRSLGTFDGDTMVGCLGTYSWDMSVSGGSMPVAGTTWVAVRPTHRRRGVLRTMMTRHLDDVAARGEPLAALWASEAAIYGRFGYGRSIDRLRLSVSVDPGMGWAHTAPPAASAVRLLPVEDAVPVLDPIYRASRARRAGGHLRTPTWWAYQALATRPSQTRWVGGDRIVAVAEVDGRDSAYAIYARKEGFGEDGRPDGTLRVIELAGVDPAAEAAMWRYLLGHDLVRTVQSDHRPIDDPLHLLLEDSRRVVRTLADALHVRVIDLPAALHGRAYGESVGVTIEVTDRLLEANDGVWRVEVAPEGASVEPAEGSAPDLRMDIAAMGSLIMGGTSLRQLVTAGIVAAADPAVVRAVDAALTPDEAGWVPEVW